MIKVVIYIFPLILRNPIYALIIDIIASRYSIPQFFRLI